MKNFTIALFTIFAFSSIALAQEVANTGETKNKYAPIEERFGGTSDR